MTGSSSRERGVVLVEMTIVLPILIVLALGAAEFGMAWSNKLKAETAARAGARVGSSLGTERLADYNLLESVTSVLSEIGLEHVDRVVVFKAEAADGTLPAGCGGSDGQSQFGLCNVYMGEDLASLTEGDFEGDTGCADLDPDRWWCPTGRQDIQHLGADYLGVWVRVDWPTMTGLFGTTITMDGTAIMRIEPVGASS